MDGWESAGEKSQYQYNDNLIESKIENYRISRTWFKPSVYGRLISNPNEKLIGNFIRNGSRNMNTWYLYCLFGIVCYLTLRFCTLCIYNVTWLS